MLFPLAKSLTEAATTWTHLDSPYVPKLRFSAGLRFWWTFHCTLQAIPNGSFIFQPLISEAMLVSGRVNNNNNNSLQECYIVFSTKKTWDLQWLRDSDSCPGFLLVHPRYHGGIAQFSSYMNGIYALGLQRHSQHLLLRWKRVESGAPPKKTEAKLVFGSWILDFPHGWGLPSLKLT